VSGATSGRPLAIVADDDDVARLMLTAAAEQAGLEVAAAADGAAALAIARERPFAIALLDVEMPVLDGYQACEALRQLDHARLAPIVMITGHDDAAPVDRAYRLGATDFMPKPLNWPLIPHRLRYLLRNSSALRELERREAENRALLESIPDRIHLLDAGGRVLRILREPLPGTGREAGDVGALVPPGEAEAARRRVAATAADGLPRNHEYPEDDGRHYEMRYFRSGPGEVMAMRQDVSERRTQERRIRELAYFDGLTGLPNRQNFVEDVARSLASADQAAVLYLDINGFKRVNDTFGHAVGDDVLRMVAARLQRCIEQREAAGQTARIARFGGDEFVLFIAGRMAHTGALALSDRVDLDFSEPLSVGGRDFFVTPSIGVALYPTHGADVHALLKNADTAMYQAKGGGGPRRCVYSEAMSARAQEWLALDAHLRKAVRDEMFELYFQPKLRLADGGIVGAEALLRWFHPELGEISPGRFIPLAEESGLILDLGAWMLQAACRQLRQWRDAGIGIGLAVNVSGREFMHGEPAELVRFATAAAGLEPTCLEIEITESVLISDSPQVRRRLSALRDLGCRLALDDFGTGFSSLAYLRRFPPDSLKIDRAFIRNVHRDRGDAAIVEAILALAGKLGIEVVAEGVEEEAQRDWLAERGCALAQGYLFAKPMPGHRLEAFLQASARPAPRLHAI
jgi:diguanylate cyclase (GGDEF)-like protein